MPLLRQVHICGFGDDAPDFLPPSEISVAVPVSDAGTAASSQPAVFADEAYFYARCEAEDAVGSCVFADGTLDYVRTATSQQDNPVIGIIVGKSTETACTVQRYGESSCSFSGLEPTKRYFLDDSGGITTPPFASGTTRYVQQVGNAVSETKLFIQPTGIVFLQDVTET